MGHGDRGKKGKRLRVRVGEGEGECECVFGGLRRPAHSKRGQAKPSKTAKDRKIMSLK